jgi:STE24 endopeptidase
MGMRRSTSLRIGAAAVAAVVVAEAAVWLLRPRIEVPEPVEVAESAFFSQREIDRAEEYRGGQRLLLIATIAVEGGVLLLLALGRPRFARRGLEALGRRPLLGGAAAGAAVSVTLAVAALPISYAAHERAVDVGLSTQDFGAWIADQGRAAAISTGLAALGGAALLLLVRRFGERWWLPGAAVATGYAVIFVGLAPVLLEPIFNDFDRLRDGPPRREVLKLGERAGVEIGEVYRVDASRRSTALNAYVSGLGPTKRVVLYDTLLDSVDRAPLRSVVSHELAHVEHRDLWRGLAFVAIVSIPAMLFASLLGGALVRRSGVQPGSPAALPAYALAIAVAALAMGAIGNQLSRKVEAAADAFALELTNDPQGLIELQRKLARRNVSDPTPPGWYEAVFATHPPTLERIGIALGYARQPEPTDASSAPRPPTREGS